MTYDTLYAAPIFRHFSLDLMKVAYPEELPKSFTLQATDFPLSQKKLEEIAQSDIKFILFEEDDALFSKEAFLVAYDWKILQNQTPRFEDFCLIDSQSHYHLKKNAFFAPAIIVEMIDKDFKSVFGFGTRDNADVYEKLVAFFCTLEIEKLVDLTAANHSFQLETCFPKAWEILNELLPFKNGYHFQASRKNVTDLINEWLKEESSISLAEKLDRLTAGYRAEYYHDRFKKPQKLSLQGTSLKCSYRSKAWDLDVRNAEKLLQFKGVPIEKVSIRCPLDYEQLKVVTDGPLLKEIWLDRDVQLTQEALDLLKELPIKSLSLIGNNADVWLDYVSKTVKSLHLFEVSARGLEKLRDHEIQEIAISDNTNLSDQDFALLNHMPLKSLYLNGVKNVSACALKHVQCPSIKTVDLLDMSISREAMQAIAELSMLESLALSHCRMKRKDLDLLLHAKALKSLYLYEMSIDEEQLAKLRAKGICVTGKFLPPEAEDTPFDDVENMANISLETTQNRGQTARSWVLNPSGLLFVSAIALMAIFNGREGS